MADDPDDEGQGGDDGQGAGQGGGGGGGGVDGQELRQTIREVLAEMGFGPGGAGGAGEGGGADGGSGSQDPPATGGRLIDQERYFEGLVRDVLADLKTKEEVGSLKEEVRKIMERPPKKYRRITSVLWGGGDDD